MPNDSKAIDNVRLAALDRALQWAGSGPVAVATIMVAAKMFEAYLTGDATPCEVEPSAPPSVG